MKCTSFLSTWIFLWIKWNILKSTKVTKLKSHKQNVLNEMNILTFEWFKSTKNAEVVTEQRDKEWRETESKVTQMPGCLNGNFRKCPKSWPWHSPFWLDLSFYVCWGSSEIRWGLSHSSSLPWWSLTSQISDTFSQKVTRDVFYCAVKDQVKLPMNNPQELTFQWEAQLLMSLEPF